MLYIGAGTIFCLREQKLNYFWLGEQNLTKDSQDNQIQNIIL